MTIAQWIVRTLRCPDDAPAIEALRAEVKTMCPALSSAGNFVNFASRGTT